MKTVRIGDRLVGPGRPCLIAAEVGLNHNGDFDRAVDLIDAAAHAGADAVKFQNYRTEDFLGDRSLTYRYRSQGRDVEESQWEMFKRCEMPDDWLRKLRGYCEGRRLLFFSTPTSAAGVAALVAAKAPMLKNGSDCLGHVPLVQAMGRSGLPTILSTGMATLAEVDDAVRTFRAAGGRDLLLLQCTSAYPTPPADVHLRKLPALAAAFECPVGLSDHTQGYVAAVGAVALGACFLEKHFTLDRNLPGPDHWFSADPAELADYVAAVRTLEQNLGNSAIGPTPAEAEARRGYRLSCVAARALRAGETLDVADIAFRRPGTGLPPGAASWIVGLAPTRDVPQGHVFQTSDFTSAPADAAGGTLCDEGAAA